MRRCEGKATGKRQQATVGRKKVEGRRKKESPFLAW